MITTFFFIIMSMIYNLIISYLFFSKTRVNSPEIKIFGYLLITNFVGLFLELYNRVSITMLGANNIFTPYTCKLYLCYYIVYMVLFFKYFIAISFSHKEYKKYSLFFDIFCLIIMVFSVYFIFSLPIQINRDNGIYLTGVGIETMFSIMSIFLLLIILIYIFRYRHIDKRKYISCLSFIILCGLFGFIQKYFPFITLTTSMQTVVLYIMYNTIENPDSKMLQRVQLAKLLMERSNGSKNEMMDNISKDIRNPLNSIIGFSEDLKKYENSLPSELNEDIDYILESSNNILDVVNNITDIKDSAISNLELVVKPYSLKKEINAIKNSFKTKINTKVNFVVNMDENLPDKLIGDKTYISEVINNMLSVSLNNTKSGEIELYIKGESNNNKCDLLFIIKDTGIGYKKDELLDLKYLGNDDNIKIDEKNILFAISKNIIDLMEGKMEIDSKYKEGSTVSIIIPQEIFVEETKLQEDLVIDYSNKHILVVDDNNLNIKVLSRALSELRINIDSVTSGEDALDRVHKGNNYDLILMDIMMPKLSGTETLKKLQEINGFSTPVVALTADASSKAREKYLDNGFVDYISKPFSKKDIKIKIHSILK